MIPGVSHDIVLIGGRNHQFREYEVIAWLSGDRVSGPYRRVAFTKRQASGSWRWGLMSHLAAFNALSGVEPSLYWSIKAILEAMHKSHRAIHGMIAEVHKKHARQVQEPHLPAPARAQVQRLEIEKAIMDFSPVQRLIVEDLIGD